MAKFCLFDPENDQSSNPDNWQGRTVNLLEGIIWIYIYIYIIIYIL